MDEDQSIDRARLVPVVVTRTRRATGWERINRHGWVILSPLAIIAVVWIIGGSGFPVFFWIMIAVAMSGGAAGSATSRRLLTQTRTLLVEPQWAARVHRALEAVMRTDRAEEVWRALDEATDTFGAITDRAFYSWVDAEITALPPSGDQWNSTTGWSTNPGPTDGPDANRPPQTWVQPPH